MTAVRTLLADDHHEVRSALRLLLEQQVGMAVVGEVAEADALPASMETLAPDLLLLDWELPRLEPAHLLPALRALIPHLRIVALSGRPEARRAALGAGVDAFVSKNDPPEQLLAALRPAPPPAAVDAPPNLPRCEF